jgi:hypothetical protein
VQWVIIDNPYDESQNPSNPNMAASSYQQVASHSLEALSTAATDHPTYLSAGNYGDYNSHHFVGRSNSRTGYGPVMHGQNHQNTDINFLLNPSNTPANMIDPNLEVTAADENTQQSNDQTQGSVESGAHGIEGQLDDKEHFDNKVQSEEQVAFLLRNYAEVPES